MIPALFPEKDDDQALEHLFATSYPVTQIFTCGRALPRTESEQAAEMLGTTSDEAFKQPENRMVIPLHY